MSYLPTFTMNINDAQICQSRGSVMGSDQTNHFVHEECHINLYYPAWLQLTRYGRRQLLLWGIVSEPSWGLLAMCQNWTQLQIVAQLVFTPKRTFCYLTELGEMIKFDDHILQMGGLTTNDRYLPVVRITKTYHTCC